MSASGMAGFKSSVMSSGFCLYILLAGVLLMVSMVNASSLRITCYQISNSRKNKFSFPITLAAESYGLT